MKSVSRFRLVLFLSLVSLSAYASGDVVFDSGKATLTFFAGGQTAPTVIDLDPIPGALSMQLNATVNEGTGTAHGQAGIQHIEGSDEFGVQYIALSGVSQTDPDGLQFDNPAYTYIDILPDTPATWQIVNTQFGPTAYGYANFPNISGEVAAGIGSFARFELLDVVFDGHSTRSVINFTMEIDTPGPFQFGFFDQEVLSPNFIPVGQFESISAKVRFTARGIGGESRIELGVTSGMSPIPEPSFGVGLFGLISAGMVIRLRRRSCQR